MSQDNPELLKKVSLFMKISQNAEGSPEADAALKELAELDPNLFGLMAEMGKSAREAAEAEKRETELRSQIYDALNSGGFIFEREGSGTTEWVDDDTITGNLYIEGDADDYIGNLAHDLVVLFGPAAFIGTYTPVVNNYNVTVDKSGGVKADFDIMRTMNPEAPK